MSTPILLLSFVPGMPSFPAVQDPAPPTQADLVQRLARLEGEVQSLRGADQDAWWKRFTLGGYGEIHFNNVEGRGGDQIDIHRLVAYVGYRFDDWIQLHSEVEIEHAFVGEDGDGEVAVEQLHVDFDFDPAFHVRAGRFLTPLGHVNRHHEPTSFNGVERSLYDTVVIPSTWSADGAGAFGDLGEDLSYELYVQSGLDGTGFSPTEGLREGRQEGSAGVSHPAVSGRVDWSPPLAGLRIGVSALTGGYDNGAGGDDPGLSGDVTTFAADASYSFERFDVRGNWAYSDLDGAAELGNGTASQIDGWNLEVAWHCLPDGWRRDRLANADLALFARWDEADTQRAVPEGVTADPAGKREELTLGVSFFPVPALVLKADYQFRDDASSAEVPDRFNLGIGWSL